MTEKLELQLVKKYPKILRDYHGDMRKTAMTWGFEFDDGWYKLSDSLLSKLQLICDTSGLQVVFAQQKEKFSKLRTYLNVENPNNVPNAALWDLIIDDLVNNAENESGNVCEVCGKYGQCCNKGHWLKTLCKEDAKKLGYKYKE